MEKVELILKVFPTPDQAQGLLKLVQDQEDERKLRLVDLAVLERSQEGVARIIETREIKGAKGALLGALAGGMLGLFAGPAGALLGAAAGAAAGGIAAYRLDFGFSDQFLKDINQALQPGTSAILILVENPWVEHLLDVIEPVPGKTFRHAVRSQLIEQLKKTFEDRTDHTD